MDKTRRLIRELIRWLKYQVKQAGAQGVVVGISGGLDSAVTARLCQLAFKKNCLALILPCESSISDCHDALKFARHFHIKTKTIDLTPVFKILLKQLPRFSLKKTHQEVNKAEANLKPRLRMLTLYYFANQLHYLVVGTGNKSELMTGYFTKYGDGGVDLLPLGGLLKSQVKQLAQALDIPSYIINKPPSAGLWPGQTDEDELGLTYPELDAILSARKSSPVIHRLPRQKLDKIAHLIQLSQHKRQPPPIFNSRRFGSVIA